VHVFASRVQGLAAGRQNVHLRSALADTLGEGRGARDHMFTAVQDEQAPARPKLGGDIGFAAHSAQMEGRTNRAGDIDVALFAREIDEHDVAGKPTRQSVGERHRDRCLADAARANDADEPPGRDRPLEFVDDRLSSNHPPQNGGQRRPVARVGGRGTGGGDRLAQDRRDKAIPTARDIGHVVAEGLTLAQSPAQCADLDANDGRLDVDASPDAVEEFVHAHHVALALDETEQDVHRAAAERHRGSLPEQQAFSRAKLERAENELVAGSMFERRTHPVSTPRESGSATAGPSPAPRPHS